IYVHGDAEIANTCLKSENDNKIGIFVKGKLTIKNNKDCTTLPGIFYAENGIDIYMNNQGMEINGAAIGDVKIVDNPEMDLNINWEAEYLDLIKIKNIDLIPQGRVVDYH